MITVSEDLREFHSYLTSRLASGEGSLSPEEILDQWRERHPSPRELADSAADIQDAVDEMRAEESDQLAREVVADVRRELGLPSRRP